MTITRPNFRNSLHLLPALTLLSVPVVLGLLSLAPNIDPYTQNLMNRLAGPGMSHPLGTDQFGRCLLARIAHGTYLSLGAAVLISLGSALMGAVLGMVAGYKKGFIDAAISRLVDTTLAFPGILLALMITGLTSGGIMVLAMALIITTWPDYCRVARSVTRTCSSAPYIQAGIILGFPTWFILYRYILPQVARPVLPLVSLGIGKSLLALSSLGFLGIGVRPPIPEWGAMISDGLPYLRTAPHLSLIPSALVFITVFSCLILSGKMKLKNY
ncbi:ABC transporter permease [Desulfonatronovibrio hydrogenovorans]|uniref:ABC transporter permease n=1 Tax=Desulfonatronovibrio hydrogenovorans TaxID=53245 RepID=UPI00068FA766|nr:ABC transporter permease [Desulfonatronovibrio hydrogenovorans]